METLSLSIPWEGNLNAARSTSWIRSKSVFFGSLSAFLIAAIGVCLPVNAQTASFHGAPAAAEQTKNPFAGKRVPRANRRRNRQHSGAGQGAHAERG